MDFTNGYKLTYITHVIDKVTYLRYNSTRINSAGIYSTTINKLTYIANMIDKITNLWDNSTRVYSTWINSTTIEKLRDITYITYMEVTSNS